MFYFSPSYAYLHKSKIDAVGHLAFLTFDRIALDFYVIPDMRLILAHQFH